MQNYIQEGLVLTLTAPYTVTSGSGAKVGNIFGIATGDVTSGDEGEFQTAGVFELTKATSQAWTQGDSIYWDNSAKKCTTAGTGNMLVGHATADAGSSDTTGFVKLLGPSQQDLTVPQSAVTDLALTTLTDTPADADALRDDLTANWETQIEGKINAILAALRSAGIIET